MVSKVKRETMRACLSCPLCDHVLRDATTISECLHTFCRKCIYEKITEDEIETCPVCNIDLGGTPLEKLRPDHNLQDLRAKIFPLKRRKVKAPEIVSLPAKRKERSISSLVVSTPRVSAQAGTTGRRTKSATRKELRNGSLAERSVKKEESSGDELLESKSSLDTLNKFTQNKRQLCRESFNKENKDGDEPWDSKLDWKPLNFLVEVAHRTKPLKSSASQGSGSKSEHANASHNQSLGKKTKTKDRKRKSKREDEMSNNGDPTTSETATPKRLRRTQRKRSAITFGDSRNLPQPDESSAELERRNGPVWFSLVASTDQEGQTSLPQIPANFLRIRDGNIPVSFIQKYLMRKLDLESVSETEVSMFIWPVDVLDDQKQTFNGFCTDRDKVYGRSGDPDTEDSQSSGSMAAEKFKAPTVCCINRFLCKGFYDGACLCSEDTGMQQVKDLKTLVVAEEDFVPTAG